MPTYHQAIPLTSEVLDRVMKRSCGAAYSIQPDRVGELLEKAEEELFAIAELVRVSAANWIVGFHCQQVVEKALKAILVSKGETPERTHDIVRLIRTVEVTGIDAPEWLWELEDLNPYSVQPCYENLGMIEERGASDLEVLAR
ncbi:MAG TPA: HEPN domain-containing protein [Chloroflexota bacterium]|nr:HEPN domain-containing protein [Chloroflexota bacterium]